jgi:hypothetical protein
MQALTPTTSSPADSVPSHAFAGGLAGGWARLRYDRSPWSYQHAGSLAALRIVIGVFLVGVGAALTAHGYAAVAALPFAGAILHFVIGSLDVAVARSRPRHC